MSKTLFEALHKVKSTDENVFILLDKRIPPSKAKGYIAVEFCTINQSTFEENVKVIYWCEECKEWQISQNADDFRRCEYGGTVDIYTLCPSCRPVGSDRWCGTGWTQSIPNESELYKLLKKFGMTCSSEIS